ncbi:MAG: copper resistance protein B [Pseudomonadota bacterium]|nr:copper resistance protein B [Pseudomonadota bacterium]
MALAVLPQLGMHAQEHDHGRHVFVMAETHKLEYRAQSGSDLLVAEGSLRVFSDRHGVTAIARTEYDRGGDRFESAEFQALYQRPVSDFWDIRAGIRHDLAPEPQRTYAVIGFSGLAPQFIETAASLFVSQRGVPSLRIEGELDLRLTQSLVLQPAMELEASLGDDRAIDLGTGLSRFETGLRLRYEITREVAPYLGVSHERALMRTADFARAAGEDPSATAFVVGLKLFF